MSNKASLSFLGVVTTNPFMLDTVGQMCKDRRNMDYSQPTRPTYTRPDYNTRELSAYQCRENFFAKEEMQRKLRMQEFLHGIPSNYPYLS
jgi:hypothetical protein